MTAQITPTATTHCSGWLLIESVYADLAVRLWEQAGHVVRDAP